MSKSKSKSKSKWKQEESLRKFWECPRPRRDYDGTVWLFDADGRDFYRVAFGDGSNLSGDDADGGFDDYIMVSRFSVGAGVDFQKLVGVIRRDDPADISDFDCPEGGVEEADGGQWLLSRKEWENGDIRRYLLDACEFAGYVGTGSGLFVIHAEA